MDLENINGLMGILMKENGNLIKWMEEVNSKELIILNILGNLLMITKSIEYHNIYLHNIYITQSSSSPYFDLNSGTLLQSNYLPSFINSSNLFALYALSIMSIALL